MVIKLNYLKEQVEIMIRKLSLAILVSSFLFLSSCARERIGRANQDGIEIMVISTKEGKDYVVFQPEENIEDWQTGNYIEIGISGGIVPDNMLYIHIDTLTNKKFIGYTDDVYSMHLDSSFVFLENPYNVCSDYKTFGKRECTEFDIFYVLNDSYR